MPVISHVSLSIRIGYWSRRARVFLTEVDFPTRILSSLAERVTTPSDWRTCSGFPGALFVLGFWSRLGVCIWQYGDALGEAKYNSAGSIKCKR